MYGCVCYLLYSGPRFWWCCHGRMLRPELCRQEARGEKCSRLWSAGGLCTPPLYSQAAAGPTAKKTRSNPKNVLLKTRHMGTLTNTFFSYLLCIQFETSSNMIFWLVFFFCTLAMTVVIITLLTVRFILWTYAKATSTETRLMVLPWLHSPGLQSHYCWIPSGSHLERRHSGSGCTAWLEKCWWPAMNGCPKPCIHLRGDITTDGLSKLILLRVLLVIYRKTIINSLVIVFVLCLTYG